MGFQSYGAEAYTSLTSPVGSSNQPRNWLNDPSTLTEAQRQFYLDVHARWVRRNGRWHLLETAQPKSDTLDFILRTEIRGTFAADPLFRDPGVLATFVIRLILELSDGLLDFTVPRTGAAMSFPELRAFIQEKAQDHLAQAFKEGWTWTDEATMAMDWINQADLWQIWCCYHTVQSRLLEAQQENWLAWLKGDPSNMGNVSEQALLDIVRSIRQRGFPNSPAP